MRPLSLLRLSSKNWFRLPVQIPNNNNSWGVLRMASSNQWNRSPNELMSKICHNPFQVTLSVKKFRPDEITVKVVGNNVVVEGRHSDAEQGHQCSCERFLCQYALPSGCTTEGAFSTISSDGVLTVIIPKWPTLNEHPKHDEQ